MCIRALIQTNGAVRKQVRTVEDKRNKQYEVTQSCHDSADIIDNLEKKTDFLYLYRTAAETTQLNRLLLFVVVAAAPAGVVVVVFLLAGCRANIRV